MEAVFSYIGELLGDTLLAVATSLAHNLIVLAFAIVTAVLLKTYVNTEKLSRALLKRRRVSIFLSVAVGAFTPFCACGTMAVIIGMLTTTLPWGPIMAFLTSSPLMSPDGFILISGMISLRFAVALTLASVLIGLVSGFLTNRIERSTDFLKNQARYMDPEKIDGKKEKAAPCACSAQSGVPACAGNEKPLEPACGLSQDTDEGGDIGCGCTKEQKQTAKPGFAEKYKLRELGKGLVDLGLKQILLYFSIFVAVGYLINHFVPTSIISALFGANSILSVPLAAVIGLPLYITTDAAIPIIQSMIKSGAGEGAMLAFIITGSATSAFVIAGLSTFLRKRAILLYVGYVLAGGLVSGYLYDLALLIF
jgi:uncharacterized membrane protein YraQ (UPF0718 family)